MFLDTSMQTIQGIHQAAMLPTNYLDENYFVWQKNYVLLIMFYHRK